MIHSNGRTFGGNMRTEGDFNGYLSKKFNRLKPELKYIKIADKFTIGISDFLMWRYGKSCAIESKFIKEWPKRMTSKVLSHPFKGTQISFLKEMDMAGCNSFGLIGVECEKKMYLIPHRWISEGGNFRHDLFLESNFQSFDFKDIEGLLEKVL